MEKGEDVAQKISPIHLFHALPFPTTSHRIFNGSLEGDGRETKWLF
jgi:hypothetical protein